MDCPTAQVDYTKPTTMINLVVGCWYFAATIPLTYLIYRVNKIVEFRDPVILLMLICIELSMLATVALSMVNIAISSGYYCGMAPYICVGSFVSQLSNMFLATAILLNINKWCQFVLIIQEQKHESSNYY
jgi:hypothetical protein